MECNMGCDQNKNLINPACSIHIFMVQDKLMTNDEYQLWKQAQKTNKSNTLIQLRGD